MAKAELLEKLPLCQRVYDVLGQSPQFTWKITEVVPELELASGTGIETFEEGDTLVVGMTKKTNLAVFVEAHLFWHQNIAPHRNPGYLQQLTADKLWEVYLVTVGYLLTTNENHTIVQLHYDALMLIAKGDNRMLVMSREFELISGLVNSRLKRINKSSSLWFLMKKLTVDFVHHDAKLYSLLLQRTFKSLELHFANYYAANFINWLIRYNLATGTDNSTIRDLLVSHARAKLTDVSIWTCLEVYLTSSLGLEPEALQYAAESPQKYQEPSCNPQECEAFVFEQVQWLLAADCTVITPYKCLVIPLIRQKSDLTPITPALLEFLHRKLTQLQLADPSEVSYVVQQRFCHELTRLVLEDSHTG